ncbi:MAG: glycosyltransferase [Ginsengibacter sp.]
MENPPLVSILLLSMNHEAYIKECIQSLQNQTYQNIEIIYLDNASSDHTFQTGKLLLEKSGIPFKTFQNTESKSISQNINFLLEQSSGTYISPLSADDWFEKGNIEKKITFFLSHNEVGALFSNGWIYNESKKEMILNDASSFKRGNIYKETLTQPDCMFYVGVMYKREIIDQVGKWDETLLIEDVDMYIRIALISKIDFISDPLVYYRRTESSASKNKTFMLKGFHQYYEKYKNTEWINMKQWLAERYRSMATSCIDQKNNREAGSFLREAIRLNPLGLKNFRTLSYLIKNFLSPKK